MNKVSKILLGIGIILLSISSWNSVLYVVICLSFIVEYVYSLIFVFIILVLFFIQFLLFRLLLIVALYLFRSSIPIGTNNIIRVDEYSIFFILF